MSAQTKEYRWALVVSVLIVLLGSLPLILGYASQTSEQRFVGTIYDRQDFSIHMAMMHYGAQGGWDYQFRFTTEPHATSYIKTIYVVLGHVSAWLGIPMDVFFQLVRVLFGLLACISIYRLLMRIFPSVNQRRLAFLLAILGSGLAWLQTPLGLLPDPKVWPIDLWLIDAYPFFSIALFPHFSAALIGMALALTAFLDHMQHPNWRNVSVIVVCAWIVQIINPIDFLLVDCAMGGAFVFSCWQKHQMDWRLALTLGLFAAVQVPILLYTFILLTRDPAWAVFNSQNILPSPPPLYYLFGLGLFWPFALVGAIRAIRKPDAVSGLALFWLVAALVMAYAPTALQRRFVFAITIPLALLAIPVIFDFSFWLRNKFRVGRLTGALAVVTLTSLGSLFMVLIYSANVLSRPPNLFDPEALVQATDWLAQNGTAQDVVLASEPTAELVAIRTPLRLYFGHEMETLHYAEKALQVENFYRGIQAENWLKSVPVTWVVFGPDEKQWGQSLPVLPELKIAYQNDQVAIYRVVLP